MDKFNLRAYEWSYLYKERIKFYHDKKIEKRDFRVGDFVLYFNLSFKLFSGKLKSKWSGPFKVTQVISFVVVEVENKDGKSLRLIGNTLSIMLDNMNR